jgi:hypothetical protein
MKKIAVIFLFFYGLSMVVYAQARFTDVEGKVEIQKTGSTAWKRAEIGEAIDANTLISTGFNSKATIQLGESVVNVQQLTRMVFQDIVETEEVVATNLHLDIGRISADVRATEGRSANFKVSSPLSTAAVRGTSFDFDGEELLVEEGSVLIENSQGQAVTVEQGQRTEVVGTEPPKNVADIANEDVLVTIVDSFLGGDDEITDVEFFLDILEDELFEDLGIYGSAAVTIEGF